MGTKQPDLPGTPEKPEQILWQASIKHVADNGTLRTQPIVFESPADTPTERLREAAVDAALNAGWNKCRVVAITRY